MNHVCTNQTANGYHSYKLPMLLVLLTITTILFNVDCMTTTQNILYTVIHTTNFITSFCEFMLIHAITSSIKNEYKTINRHLCSFHKRISLNKIVPANNQRNSKKIERKQNCVDMQEVQHLLETHYQLTLLAKDVNKFFGIPMLIALSSQFASFTIDIYYTMINFKLSNINAMNLAMGAFWIIIRSVYIWHIVKTWDSVAQEVTII